MFSCVHFQILNATPHSSRCVHQGSSWDTSSGYFVSSRYISYAHLQRLSERKLQKQEIRLSVSFPSTSAWHWLYIHTNIQIFGTITSGNFTCCSHLVCSFPTIDWDSEPIISFVFISEVLKSKDSTALISSISIFIHKLNTDTSLYSHTRAQSAIRTYAHVCRCS